MPLYVDVRFIETAPSVFHERNVVTPGTRLVEWNSELEITVGYNSLERVASTLCAMSLSASLVPLESKIINSPGSKN